MTKNKRFKITVLLCTSILIGFYGYSINIPQPFVPDIALKTLDNKFFQLKSSPGKMRLINFWATDCPSCLHEIPELKKLHQHYHKKGLDILAVNMFYDPPSHVVRAKKIYTIPYHLVLDLDKRIATAFGDVQLTPTTFLINPEGNIIYQKTGLFNSDIIIAHIETYLH